VALAERGVGATQESLGSGRDAMGYYIRAFCTAQHPPRLADIQGWLRERGSRAVLDDPDHAVMASRDNAISAPILDLDTSEWQQVALIYKVAKLPILAECSRDDGKQDSLLHAEVREFADAVREALPEDARTRVLAHLQATQFIVACQLPTSDIDDDGYDANGYFLAYFVKHCGAMIQADGEGFYDGSTMILPLR
jgi:hypothetical protein